MKPEIKAAWLAALRSGEYQQAHGELRHNNTFCCLGVLCDLAAKQGVGQWTDDGVFVVGNHRYESTLPAEVAYDWADLNSCIPVVGDAGLIVLNDGVDGHAPHSFEMIADLIEAHL